MLRLQSKTYSADDERDQGADREQRPDEQRQADRKWIQQLKSRLPIRPFGQQPSPEDSVAGRTTEPIPEKLQRKVASKQQFQSKLNLPLRICCSSDRAEVCVTEGTVGIVEIYVIEDVEELSPKL